MLLGFYLLVHFLASIDFQLFNFYSLNSIIFLVILHTVLCLYLAGGPCRNHGRLH